MTKYRGVEQRAIIDAARKAETFLRSLDIGLYTDAWLDSWQEEDPFKQILAARNEEDLAHAVKMSMTGFAFIPYKEVFEYHALKRLAENGDDSVLKIYRDLQAWGAFDQNIVVEMPETHIEANFHLLQEYLDDWRNEETSPGSPAASAFSQAIEESRQKNKAAADQAESLLPILLLLDDSSDAEGLIRTIIESPDAFGIMKEAIHKATPAYALHDRLNVPTPLSTYRVSIGPKPENLDGLKPLLVPILEDMLTALYPYLLLDEVRTEPGSTKVSVKLEMSQGDEDMVLVFESSRRAAQDVAKLMPGFVILDKDMKRVMPPDRGSSPDRGPRPGF